MTETWNADLKQRPDEIAETHAFNAIISVIRPVVVH